MLKQSPNADMELAR